MRRKKINIPIFGEVTVLGGRRDKEKAMPIHHGIDIDDEDLQHYMNQTAEYGIAYRRIVGIAKKCLRIAKDRHIMNYDARNQIEKMLDKALKEAK